MTRKTYYTVTTYPQFEAPVFKGGEFTKKASPRHKSRRQKRRVVTEKYGIVTETRIFGTQEAAKDFIKKKKLSSATKTHLHNWWS